MSFTLLFGGDVMLGRLVNQAVETNGPDYPLGEISQYFSEADISIVNLECAITSSKKEWHGMKKAFYFGANPIAAEILSHLGINVVSLANNHILDFDYQGLEDTLHYLKEQNIQCCGAGNNLSQAKTPAIIKHDDLTIGMLAYCDHQKDFSANTKTAGMNYIDLADVDTAIKHLQKDFSEYVDGKIDIPILSLHWGPNMILKPSSDFIELAHGAIDIGYKIIFGHSAHVFQGVEIYQSCPIIYSAGDLVDDYAVDSYYKNDHGLLFKLEVDDANTVSKIKLMPVFIEECQTRPVNKNQREFIRDRFVNQCDELGTTVHCDDKGNMAINLEDH